MPVFPDAQRLALPGSHRHLYAVLRTFLVSQIFDDDFVGSGLEVGLAALVLLAVQENPAVLDAFHIDVDFREIHRLDAEACEVQLAFVTFRRKCAHD